jgi:putative NIF3 family GTP cyclohydrolase 1 type 2
MKASEIVEAIDQYYHIGNSHIGLLQNATCDIYIAGSPDTEITGVVTTFMATVDVIRQAVKLGANMIITHEPTWFTGSDRTDWLADDPVYLAKKKLIEEHHLVIWRCHDRMHVAYPDGIYEGLERELGWEGLRTNLPDGDSAFKAFTEDFYVIPETTLGALATFFKKKLDVKSVRIIGKPEMSCSRIGILVGGGSLGLGKEEMPAAFMREKALDVLVCGEITEWTLCAYVNDAQMLGFQKGMIIIGHERSEGAGMKYMAQWLAPRLPGVPVDFIEAGEPFSYL